ncbi:MAG: hypothetical protein GOMPHAMPRED_004511 [Gomphillus americanus]|uniref:Uncharacterized protein n=1 Tax=Gomphillus americanus TaxID=1940652 RepID=A0A8H3FU33_9LECA|nr:MAG: hypothetical protein GOMPHAMPRED_004511 [Gomphillus americanus]
MPILEHTDSGYASRPRRSDKSYFDPQINASAKQDDDVATVYSAASSFETVAKDSYVEAMARLLWEEIHPLQVDDLPFKDISALLCDFFGQFALRFGSGNPDDAHKRIMIFVHKTRRQIASVLGKIAQQKQDEEDETSTSDSKPGISVDEKMALWMTGSEKLEIEYDAIELHQSHQEEDRDLANCLESLIVYDPNYEWLVRRVQ